MLERLAQRDNSRVGIRFYGHRVGWNTAQSNQLMRQSKYGRPISPDLRPYEDVELVLPLGRFDSVAAGTVSDLLRTVQPWGETPLYLAIIQALRDFDADDEGTERSVVVITDGVNYQFNPSADLSRNRQDVIDAWNRARIPIHIVGFGISAAESDEAQQEFGNLAETTKGSYVPATNAASLMRTLEALIGSSVFTVSDAQENEVGQSSIGSTVTVDPGPVEPTDYTIKLGTAQRKH